MIKELRDGLILRSLSEGVASDRENMGQFYTDVFTEFGDEDAETFVAWTADLISDAHPTTSLDDFWVVVDPSKNDQIVSAVLYVPQVWRMEDIEIPTGRVELVATNKDYRRRGLVRELINAAHQRGDELGHMMQGITGISHYYRRFGYAMAVDLGSDTFLPISSIPKLKKDQKQRYTLRPATNSDIPNLLAWESYEYRDCNLTVKHDETIWDYEINHRTIETPMHIQVYIIANDNNEDVGFVVLHMDHYYPRVSIHQYIVGEESSYLDTYDDVLREIKRVSDAYYADSEADKHPVRLVFENGVSPAIKALVYKTDGGLIRDRNYAWYIRVPDIPALMKHIAPVLARRLAVSGANRYTGEFKISFHTLEGLKMTFKNGELTDAVIEDMAQYVGDTALPFDTFLNVLFGHRTWEELNYALPDIYANRKAHILLNALFPKMRSQVLGLA